MRLDKYLKLSRLIRRRTVAKAACDQGRVLLNGRPAKAAAEVKPGDTLAVRYGGHTLEVVVLEAGSAGPRDPAQWYRVVASRRGPSGGGPHHPC